jgi:hypothetical protein
MPICQLHRAKLELRSMLSSLEPGAVELFVQNHFLIQTIPALNMVIEGHNTKPANTSN